MLHLLDKYRAELAQEDSLSRDVLRALRQQLESQETETVTPGNASRASGFQLPKMSYNQPRPGRSDNQQQYRRTGRSTAGYHQQQQPHQSSPAGYGRGAATANVDPSSNRSFKKPSNSSQGGGNQARVNHSVPNNHNGPTVQSCSSQGASGESVTGGPASGAIPKGPTSQSPTMNTAKVPGDASKGFAFQFGSLGPDLMKMQQAAVRTAAPNLPASVPKKDLPNKAADNQLMRKEGHNPSSEKADVHVQHTPPPSQTHKSPLTNIRMPSLQTPYQHPHPVHFGGPPNMHMQRPNVAPASFQMPMALSMGNTPQIQQQVFFQGLPSHPMHHQGMMHQPQGHGFTAPIGAQIHPQLGHVGVVASHHEHDSYPTPGKVMDCQRSSGRSDRRPSTIVVDDRWAKNQDPHPAGYGGSRPSQGGNSGVIRNPRMQGPVMSRPMRHVGPMGGMGRNTPDLERWQRGSDFQQKELFPSPHTPMQVMHEAERRYQVGTVAEQTKQKKLTGILNKLTPQNFEKLLKQVTSINIDNAVTLIGVVSQIFDKALMEPTFGEMYAELCFHLSGALPDFNWNGKRITFKRLLLNKCQEEFERGKKEEEEASRVAEEGQTEEEREEKRLNVRKRMLCNIRLIGELYKKRILTEKIMHACIQKLLGYDQEDPHEENIEALCKLMSTIGVMIDHHKAKSDKTDEKIGVTRGGGGNEEMKDLGRSSLLKCSEYGGENWVSDGKGCVWFGFEMLCTSRDVGVSESVSYIFRRHPDIALGFRPKNQQIRRAYMNELLSLMEMLCQSPEKLSQVDLNNADDTLSDMVVG
ncbi:unnamed protein product [Eruca vesicaria subsp. sativa]|uniref:MIF4G domain-containing protein n=1 Tax=Eruca vesicaria subsp. sativa TaxID=29727 RepID=A0ABC8KWU6_ERUVS|nr:unnamed protein product [Eruca vesicaria subsp. sativa]